MSNMSHTNEFYVHISSHGSSKHFKNTRALFTNQLATQFKLSRDWNVGLTEVIFSSIKTKTSDDSLSVRRRKRHVEIDENDPKLVIHPFGKDKHVKIQFPRADFRRYAYSKSDMNFGAFLRALTAYVDPPLQFLKIKVKMELLKAINNRDPNIRYPVYLPKKSYGDILHVYAGSPSSVNIELYYHSYNSFEDWLSVIYLQLPDFWTRDTKKMLILFNLFLPTVDLLSMGENGLKNDLEINFIEYGTILSLSHEKIQSIMQQVGDIRTKIVSDIDLVNAIANNYKLDNENLTLETKNKLLYDLKQATFDVFRNFRDDQTHIVKTITENDVILNLNIDGVSFPVILELKKYKSIADVILDLYKQIPIEKRSPQIVVGLLREYLGDVTSLVTIEPDGSAMTTESNVKEKTTLNENGHEMILSEPKTTPISTKTVFICTDVCQVRIFGSSLSRFLRCICIPNCNAVTSIRFDHIEYLAISKFFLHELTIFIVDDRGIEIEFNDEIETIATLHFKKSK